MRIKKLTKCRDIVPLSEVLAWCKRQRRHAPEGTPRHATYVLLIETLEHLRHERDVEDIPTTRLEKLTARARTICGWVTPRLSTTPPPGTHVPADHKFCPKCRCVKPTDAFLRRVTDRQRQVFGWNNKRSIRWMLNPYCQQCRTNNIRRRHRRAMRVHLCSTPITALRVYLLRRLRFQPHPLPSHPAAINFYAERRRALELAIAALDHLTTDPPPRADWHSLLEDTDRRRLIDAYHLLLMQRLPGRSPRI